MRHILFVALIGACAMISWAQEKVAHPVFEVRIDAMLDSLNAILDGAKPDKDAKKNMMMVDFAAVDQPKEVKEFTTVKHLPPLLQGRSGMCWCFSATSLLESEIMRTSGRTIKLSELHTVYWEYVEKAREYVRTRGESHLGEGSEANAVFRILKQYGAMPREAFTGLKEGQKYYNHEYTLFPEFKKYLTSVKEAGAWNEAEVIATVRALLDHHMGTPPATFLVDGKPLSPKEYLKTVVRLNPDDYVDFLSLLEHPYYTKIEFEVPDNWWHSKEYHNVPLDVFMTIVKRAIRSGYSLAIGGDFSEAGYSRGKAGIAVVPSFDIPSSAIDDAARQFRFSNGTTADDHGLHLVGYVERNGKDWYLIKDSWSSAYNSTHPGYYFYHEDYVKLKMLGVALHKDAVRDILEKFPR